MGPEPKVSDEDLVRLRSLSDEGWSNHDLAEAFGVSPQHVGRLVRGEQRPTIAGLDSDALREGVTGAVEAFLVDARLDAADDVLAATARALAGKLDACSRSDSAASAQATPRLAAQLVNVLVVLREGVPREPDAIDRLRQERDARRLAAAAGGGVDAAPEPIAHPRPWRRR